MASSSNQSSVKTKQRFVKKLCSYYFQLLEFHSTDGALRMLVVLHFHSLGYHGLEIAMLFLFYELFGVVTNLVGGWLGARIGLNRTMNIGLLMQIVALLLLVSPAILSIPL